MSNKRGMTKSSNWVVFAVATGLLIATFILAASIGGRDTEGYFRNLYDSALYTANPLSFTQIFKGEAIKPLIIFDFIFGKIPGALVQSVDNPVSAAIITVLMWVVFFLIFGDIMNLFGSFSKGVNWTVAVLLTIIGANLKVVASISTFMLAALSVFGALSVLMSLGMVFALFIAFHFGSAGLRRWVIQRRAQDQALRAVAGGEEAAAGIEVLKKITEKASGKKNPF